MTKKLLLLFALTPCWAFGQQTISSAGGTLTSATDRLEYNIGDPVVGTVAAGSDMLTQGFEQPWADVGTGIPTLATDEAISVFPNPTRHDLNIQLPGNAHHAYMLFDAAGKLVLDASLTTRLTILDLTAVATGSYSLIVTDTANGPKQAFHIIINH